MLFLRHFLEPKKSKPKLAIIEDCHLGSIATLAAHCSHALTLFCYQITPSLLHQNTTHRQITPHSYNKMEGVYG